MQKLVVIAHNLRSTHNVGSLLRTCDGLGVDKVYLTGYTPYPLQKHDERLPHLAQKIDQQIHKTALGAETSVDWEFSTNVEAVLKSLQDDGFQIVALEQTPQSLDLAEFQPSQKLAVLVGREVEGIGRNEPDDRVGRQHVIPRLLPGG